MSTLRPLIAATQHDPDFGAIRAGLLGQPHTVGSRFLFHCAAAWRETIPPA